MIFKQKYGSTRKNTTAAAVSNLKAEMGATRQYVWTRDTVEMSGYEYIRTVIIHGEPVL